MHVTLQPTYYWPKTAVDVPFITNFWVYCAKDWLYLQNQASPWKLLLLFEPSESVTFDMLGVLFKAGANSNTTP